MLVSKCKAARLFRLLQGVDYEVRYSLMTFWRMFAKEVGGEGGRRVQAGRALK